MNYNEEYYHALLSYFNPTKAVTNKEHLKGRDSELESALQSISVGDCVIIQGAKRIGKTSLLHILRTVCAEQDHFCVYISFQGVGNYTCQDFSNFLLSEVFASCTVERHSIQSSLIRSFQNLIKELELEKNNKRLLLFMDEFQLTEEMPQAERINFYNLLRNVIDERPIRAGLNKLVVIIATSQSVSELSIGVSSTLASAFAQTIVLGRISEALASEFINAPFADVHKLAASVLESIVHKTGVHPYLVKILLHRLISKHINTITKADEKLLMTQLEAEFEFISNDLKHAHFMMLQHELRELDKVVLNLLLEKKRTLKAICQHELSIKDIKISLEHLEHLQIVENKSGSYHFSNEIYLRWLEQLLKDKVNGQNGKVPRLLIMKGGGVKGLAYVGAIRALENFYSFNWYAGTSAGAIAAVLLAAGYSIDELEEILSNKNFIDFMDASFFKIISNLTHHKGMFKAETFTKWLDQLLSKKLQVSFRVKLKDLPKRVTLYASREEKRALIYDSQDPKTNEIDAAQAVRASMSIPFLFTPQLDSGYEVFDGGLQNNYPVKNILEKNENTPFIGLYLGSAFFEGKPKKTLLNKVISIWSEATDLEALRIYKEDTIVIDTQPIETIDFFIDKTEKTFLVQQGYLSAQQFLLRKNLITNSGWEGESERLQEQRDTLKKKSWKWRRVQLILKILFLRNICWKNS